MPPPETLSTWVARGLHKCTNIEYYLSFSLLSHGIQLSPRTETHSIPLITLRNPVLTLKPNAPRLSLRIRAAEPRGPRPGLPRSHPTGQTGRYERERIKTKVILGHKQGNRYGGFVTGAVRLYSLIQRNYLHGDLPTKLNYYIFCFYKYYCVHSTTSPERQKSLGFAPSKLWQNTTGTSRASHL